MLRSSFNVKTGMMVVTVLLSAQSAVIAMNTPNATVERRCGECHACAVPSILDTCLKGTSDQSLSMFQHASHNLGEAPESLVLSTLTDRYSPVCFDHKAHASKSEMGSGCATCHHYSPAGEIPPCHECHRSSAIASDAKLLPLELAYHSQCRNCHQDWSNNATCTPCHHGQGAVAGANLAVDRSAQCPHDSLPLVLMPVSKVYATGLHGSYVTFQHVEHIELFGLQCTSCHQRETCSECHAACTTSANVRESRDIRLTCVCCHERARESSEGSQCNVCHDAKPHQPLFHQIVGKSLPECMGKVTCESCHKKKA